MTPRRRDLGTRGRMIVAAAAVGAVGGLGGWMAATDHTVVATPSASANGSSGSSGASTSAGASTTYDDDDNASTATPGLPTHQLTPSDARTGGS